ncbi:MAG: ComEC/Rec2 family competence protein [Patescibacteria group bacterium]|nr:ComEC/Rec2 family competence protein [Patescibacteria group bacterium]
MTASRIFLFFCLSFITGIFISSMLGFSAGSRVYLLLPGLILGILLISVFWRYKTLAVIGFCILFLVAGIWRHQIVELKIANNELRKFNELNEKISLIGIISNESDIREKSQKLTIKIQEVIQNENVSRFVNGKALITTHRYPEYQYGDKLKITGKLESPTEDIDGFNYQDYLKKDGIYSIMSWPEIELIEREKYIGPSYLIYGKILGFKNKLRESIYQNLSPPQSSILGAMVLGDKRKLSEDLKTKLKIAGVRHITAISGLHVTILTSILMTILIGLGLWRQQAFWFSIILMTLFIIMTGLQPSAIRAGIMGGLFLLGQYLGRMSVSSRSIVLAAALMLFQNPLLLRLDVGFQLSFFAMMGIIYLMPFFQDWLRFIPWKNPKSVLSMTLSAYLFTLPILIYNFGYISLVAPITNVLIIPLLPFIMLSGFIFGLAGIIFQPLGWVLSWPAWGLLTYLTKIVNWLSGFPLASLTIENLHWIWLIISYLILGFITWRLQKSQKLKFLQY